MIGSPLVVGDPSIPVGIVLNGKEEPIGLLPALVAAVGPALAADDEMATLRRPGHRTCALSGELRKAERL